MDHSSNHHTTTTKKLHQSGLEINLVQKKKKKEEKFGKRLPHTALSDRGGRHSLCVTFERPECRLATDIKQADHFVFTSGYQQLTIRPEPATVSRVSEPCE